MSETAEELTPEQQAEIDAEANRQLLARCAEDRRKAKMAMLVRCELLKDGETLDEYDARTVEASD